MFDGLGKSGVGVIMRINIHNGKWFWDFAFMQNVENQVFAISEYRITNIRSVYEMKIQATILIITSNLWKP
jgi:hypothetical protein